MNLFTELKRRNVFKVATAYLVVSWLTLQVFGSVAAPLGFPEWVHSFIIVLIGVGLPIALIFAWAFEMTPDGVKPTSEVDASASITKETSRKIDYIIIGALVLIIGGMAYTGNFSIPENQQEEVASIEYDKTIAVLPFVNMSSDQDQEWFADGLTEEILNSLSMLPELQVSGRTSSFYYKGKNIPLPEIAERLNVTYIVEGSVRRGGDILRITAQLIRAKDDYHVWSNTYDKSVSDVLDIQRDVAESIAQALDVVLDEKRRLEMQASGTQNVAAFEAYHKGSALSDAIHNEVSDKTLWDANDYFSAAIEADSSYGAAHNSIQDAYSHYLMQGVYSIFIKGQAPDNLTPEEAFKQLAYHQEKAIEYAATPEQKLAYEFSKTYQSNDWTNIPRLLQEIKQDPNAYANVAGSGWFIETLFGLGEIDLALKIVQEELDRYPYGKIKWELLIGAYMIKGNFDKAIESAEKAKKYGITITYNNYMPYLVNQNKERLEETYLSNSRAGGQITTDLLVATGRIQEAQEIILEDEKKPPTNAFNLLAYHLMGQKDKAFALVRDIDNRPLGALDFGLIAIYYSRIYAPKEAAPNYLRKLRQAGVSEEKIDTIFLKTEISN